MSSEEIWKSPEKYPHIAVSNLGRFKNIRTGFPLSVSANGRGYLYINLYSLETKKITSILAARIVAELFVDSYRPHRRISYEDKNIQNIRWDNLICRDTLEVERRRIPPPRKHSRVVRIIELDKIFRNASAAANYIGGYRECVYRCLKGQQRQHLGYTFEYVTIKDALDRYRREQDG